MTLVLEVRSLESCAVVVRNSVMLANNETGIIQPVSKVASLTHQGGGFLHVDAVQGPGRIS